MPPRAVSRTILPRTLSSPSPHAHLLPSSFYAQHRQKSTTTPNYPGHIPISTFSRSLLAVGSALTSLLSPQRGDMVAVLGETSSGPFLSRLRDLMLSDESGRRLLKERPRITGESVDVEMLKGLKEGSLGREYVKWLEGNGVSPDTREPVRYIDDPELAYVMQRYRECHDFYHVITGPFPVSTSGELVVKAFELANMSLPIALLSTLFGPLRLSSSTRRSLISTYYPWALKCGSSCKPLINVEWEKLWSKDVEELRRELGIWKPDVEWGEWKQGEREARMRREEEEGRKAGWVNKVR